MKNTHFNFHLIYIFLLATFSSFAQNDTSKAKISNSLEEYFSLERENIHLQFSKDIYLSNEDVWFKGYVYNRKDKLPFFYTTNVYAVLYDSEGKKVANKLFYSNSGCFTGRFKLDNSFKTGKYYIHVFTNWMNNFKEDESASFEINVINKEDKGLHYQINQIFLE